MREDKERLLEEIAKAKGVIQSCKNRGVDPSKDGVMDKLILDGEIHPGISEFAGFVSGLGSGLLEANESHVDMFLYKHGERRYRRFFADNVSGVIGGYGLRFRENRLRRHMHDLGESESPGLSDEEFFKIYGKDPVRLLNEIFERAAFNFRIPALAHSEATTKYSLKLKALDSDVELSPKDLSDGEKVIMALGLAIYRSLAGGGKPDILLLDEPDASLHPDYCRAMIEVLNDVIVKRAGVRVVLTTHSATTVAICPEEAIYQMDRQTGTPVKCTSRDALNLLTREIPNFRVSIEDRRQVFVESMYDATFLAEIFEGLDRRSAFGFSAVFLQSHTGTSNCADVRHIVSSLQSSGADLVRGIIDWDRSNFDDPPLFVLGGGRRYSLENYLLDPLMIGLTLVKYCGVSFRDMGLDPDLEYPAAKDFSVEQCQAVVDYVLNRAGIYEKSATSAMLENGYTISLPDEFLKMNGHSWEEKLVSSFEELKRVIRGVTHEGKLKKHVVGVMMDFKGYISLDLRETFLRLK